MDGACGFTYANAGTTCNQTGECDGAGVCKEPLGALCTTSEQCISGQCVDGVCCNEACEETCKACSVAAGSATDGTCGNITWGTTDSFPANTCAGTNTCDGAGNCKAVDGQTCAAGTECASSNCVNGVCCSSTCTGPAGAPLAELDAIGTAPDTMTTIDVRANDVDPNGDTLTLTGVGTPLHGTASVASGSVAYTPASGFTGWDRFSYTVSDGTIESTGWIIVQVGSGWMDVGGSTLTPWGTTPQWTSGEGTGIATGNRPSIAIDAMDRVYIAYDAIGKVALRQWTGSVWSDLGSSSNLGGTNGSTMTSIALDASGKPSIVYSTPGFNNGGTPVVRWTGAGWTSPDNVSTGGDARMVVTSTGTQIVSFRISTNVRVITDAGGNWGNLGGSATVPGTSSVLARDATDVIYQAWISSDHVYVRRYAAGAWSEVGVGSMAGNGISGTDMASSPTIALDAAGMPYVAWDSNGEIFVRRFDGTNWVEVGAGSAMGGGISSTAGESGSPAIAIGIDGQPVVAWSENIGGANSEIYVKRFDGTSFSELAGSASMGGISSTPKLTYPPNIAIDSTNHPVVAYSDDTRVLVKRFDGVAWKGIGPTNITGSSVSASANASGSPVTEIDRLGRIHVGWSEEIGTNLNAVHARRWSGGAWEEVAGSATGSGLSDPVGSAGPVALTSDRVGRAILAFPQQEPMVAPSIEVRRSNDTGWDTLASSAEMLGDSPTVAVDMNDSPIVAWLAPVMGSVGGEIYLERWGGGAWEQIAASATGDGLSNSPTVQTRYPNVAVGTNGKLHVVFYESNSIYAPVLVVYDGTLWAPLGNLPTVTVSGYSPKVVLDLGGRPIVLYGDDRLFVARHDGTDWVGYGTPLDTGNGISGTPGLSRLGVLGRDGQGRIVAAWMQNPGSGKWQIFVRRYEGGTWNEMGGASATSGGVSTSAMGGTTPAIAARSRLVCVAWEDRGPDSVDILLRCTTE